MVGKRIAAAVQRSTDPIERLARKEAELALKRSEKQADVERCERALQAARLAELDGGSEVGTERARKAWQEAVRDLDDIDGATAEVRLQKLALVQRIEAQAVAKRDEKAREHLAEMEANLQKIFAGCEIVAAGVRGFDASRARYYAVTPAPPEPAPAVWTALDRFVMRAIGARCPVFRGTVSGLPNAEHLATVNEFVTLHRDVVARLYPEPPPPAVKAA